MTLDRESWLYLQAFVDKEVMPYECDKVSKKYNICHIRYEAERVLGFEVKTGLIAKLLRQRGVAETERHGITYFAISNEFFEY